MLPQNPKRSMGCISILMIINERVALVRETREQLDAAHLLVQALPQILGEVSRQEQEQLIMALIDRIDVDGNGQASIHLRLDVDVIRALPNLQPAASHPHELLQSNGSQPE